MNLYPRHFARIAAAGFIVLIGAVAVIRSQRSEDASTIAPLKREEADALASELARCRTVTSDQIAYLENCRRVWLENRQQFFGPSTTLPSSVRSTPTEATDSGKSRDRVSPTEAGHQQREVR